MRTGLPLCLPGIISTKLGERYMDSLTERDIDLKQRHIHIRPGVAGKLAEPRYLTFTETKGSGLTQEILASLP